jgi:CubicO group peptidase (beta-lactamase class C family)
MITFNPPCPAELVHPPDASSFAPLGEKVRMRGLKPLRLPFLRRVQLTVLALLLAVPQLFAEAFHPEKLAEMDAAILAAISSNKCPGGVLWVEHNGVSYHKAYGNRALVPAVESMTEDTIFDAASLTKVCAGTPAVMVLVERGQVKLDAPVKTYIPEFTGDGRDDVTVKELLTHTSGLPPDVETKTDWHGEAEAVKKACAAPLQNKPGTVFKYSDINLFMIGEIVQRVSKLPLEVFVQKEIDGHRLPAAERKARSHRPDGSGRWQAVARRGA